MVRGDLPTLKAPEGTAKVGRRFGGGMTCAQGPRPSCLLLACYNHILAGRAETRSAASCICLALPCELLSRACDVRSGVWVVRVKVGVEWCVWRLVRCVASTLPRWRTPNTFGSYTLVRCGSKRLQAVSVSVQPKQSGQRQAVSSGEIGRTPHPLAGRFIQIK